eukprot:Gb_27542 [translate_table: standard]
MMSCSVKSSSIQSGHFAPSMGWLDLDRITLTSNCQSMLKDMAERLPGGAHRHNRLGSLPSYTPNGANPPCSNDMTVTLDSKGTQSHGYRITSIPTFQDADYNGTISPAIGNGHVSMSNKLSVTSNQGRLVDDSKRSSHGQSIDEGARHGSIAPTENEREQETEWVEQDEQGVYITLTSLPGGGKDLKRVRFSRKRFSERQAEQWWAENRARVYEQYNVRIVDKASVGPQSTSGRLECIEKL